jgi:pilus assembly protein Flp/PilA
VKARTLPVLRSLHGDESGQDLVEYALIVALIAVGAVAAMDTVATKIIAVFSTIGSILSNAV